MSFLEKVIAVLLRGVHAKNLGALSPASSGGRPLRGTGVNRNSRQSTAVPMVRILNIIFSPLGTWEGLGSPIKAWDMS